MIVGGGTLTVENIADYGLENMQEKWAGVVLNCLTEQADQDSISQKISASIQKFEVFISELKEIEDREDLSKIPKREIIFPASLMYERLSYKILNVQKTSLLAYNCNQVSVEDLLINISYNDLFLIYSSMAYQLEKYNAEKEMIEAKNAPDSPKSDSSFDESTIDDILLSTQTSDVDQSTITGKCPNPRIEFDDVYVKAGILQLVKLETLDFVNTHFFF